ncbi:MAG: putative PHD type zinc finger protein with BAH domain-containing protein [Chrysothrix sp. TS-e1954]|nr:MAG: putative PHD type zinc finger protein with BAH domain-containing protein [Chrysothrix sp. TS-e1954]
MPALKGASSTSVSASASQPMTRVASTSSDASAKDESNAAVPYGTRSRNRGGTRPNYADNDDTDVELPAPRASDPAVRRYAAFDGGMPSTQNGNATRNSATTLRLPNGAQNGAQNGHLTPKGLSGVDPSTVTGERKKRKYERHAPSNAKSALNQHSAASHARDGPPGTSQFSTAPNTIDAPPPSKKRKTGENLPTSTEGKRSASHGSKHVARHTSLVSFRKSKGLLKNGKLEADDGVKYAVDDHVYLVCEPPGDPYYLARIMEFRHAIPEDPKSPVAELLVNWFYRPKDIQRYSSDVRCLLATMQSDVSPLNALRGKCQVRHRSEIKDFDGYRKQRDAFWFNQLYDRYSKRPYEMIASSAVVNVPERVKKAIDERWKFLVVESARYKELGSEVKLCKRCSSYCAPNDAVDCGVCEQTWHMGCVQPPMTKKPARGFAWTCGPCSKARERKLEERLTTVIAQESLDQEEELPEDEGSKEPGMIARGPNGVLNDDTADATHEVLSSVQADLAQVQMWPWRYLGIHCRVEDVLQYDDRAIYPRASSRLGPRHQANVTSWFGQPVQYVKPADTRKRSNKSATIKKDSKLSKEMLASLEAEKAERAQRPKWIQDEPVGYVSRGEDLDPSDPKCTATPLFVKPANVQRATFAAANSLSKPTDEIIDSYMTRARELGQGWGMITASKKGDPQMSTNFLDQALTLLSQHNFQSQAALAELQTRHTPKELKNPDFTKEELKKFEDGVHKHGSDLRLVRKHVKSRPHAEIVRFYYTWKFTERGDQIWGNYPGRRGAKRRAETSWPEIADDEDDSSFDGEKASLKKRRFQCKFCATRSSRQWRRAPNVGPNATVLADPKSGTRDKSNQLTVALCLRCALIWRRYGLHWQDPDEVAKALGQSGGRAWKRRIDEELLREFVLANETAGVPTPPLAAAAASSIGISVTVPQESERKKLKMATEQEATPIPADVPKKKAPPAQPPPPPPREPTPPIVPMEPRFRDFPCAVCRWTDISSDKLLVCKECKLTVHCRCYAVAEPANPSSWVCDTCLNDKEERALWEYSCALCPINDRQVDLVEPPKVTHKKKTDRDRERERLEKELAQKMADDYIRRQKTKGRPPYPREAVKLTASNNWVHVTCAIWTPEIRFANAAKMEGAEGMGALLTSSPRIESVCKLCKDSRGACVSCHQCHAAFHVQCAHDAGYTFGFDIALVKGSRKDLFQTVTVGTETGSMTAAIWCREHSVKTIVHDMTETVDDVKGTSALQRFVSTYKQADTRLTGAARKADLLAQVSKGTATSTTSASANRRVSNAPNATTSGAPRAGRRSSPTISSDHGDTTLNEEAERERHCATCDVDVALKWYTLPDNDSVTQGATSRWQCHKCRQATESGTPFARPNQTASYQSQASHVTADLWAALEDPSSKFMVSSGGPRPVHALPRMPQYRPALEKFAHDLWYVSIEITNPKTGNSHVFEGKHLGLSLDLDCSTPFGYVQFFAGQNCDYKREHDVIVTEDGSWVSAARQFVLALIKTVIAGTKSVKWEVKSVKTVNYVSMDDTYKRAVEKQNLAWPPVSANQHASIEFNKVRYNIPARKHSYIPPMPGHTHGPLPPGFRHPGPTIPPPPDISVPPQMHMTGRPPPLYPTGHSPTMYRPPQMSPTAGSHSSLVRPQTPGGGINGLAMNGASSSPNIRNLMH